MKALTLWQPWATMVALGVKKIETRSWPTSYRGPLAIHAAKESPREALELAFEPPFRQCLEAAGYDVKELPSGVIVAICDLADCVQITPNNMPAREGLLGDYTPGRYAWYLANVRRVHPPLPARGRQGLWDWPQGDEPLHTI
jgi:hypothetical protein